MAYYSLRRASLRPRWPIDGSEARQIAGQAAPIALIALVNMGMSVTDTFMAAGLGADTLVAVAISSDFYSILFYLAVGTVGGIAPLYAAASAAGDGARLRQLRTAGWFVAIVAAVITAPAIWFAPDLLRYVGINQDLLETGRGYCRIMALTLFPNAVAALFRARLTALQRPGLMLRVTLMALPLNAVGNWVLLYGVGDWPGLGVTGLALSSLIVWSAIALALVVVALQCGDAGGARRPDFPTVHEILRVGLPIGVTFLADAGLFLGATIYAGTFPEIEAAAHAIAIRIAGVTYSLSIGLNQATMVRIARNNALVGGQHILASALMLALGAGTLLAGTLAFSAWEIAGVQAWPETGKVLAVAAPAIALLALMECVGPLGAAADGVLRGRKDTKAAMVFALTGNWLIAAPSIYALTQVWTFGVTGLWAGLTLGVVATAAMMCARLPRHWQALAPRIHTGGAIC